jgi:hypothetical protein
MIDLPRGQGAHANEPKLTRNALSYLVPLAVYEIFPNTAFYGTKVDLTRCSLATEQKINEHTRSYHHFSISRYSFRYLWGAVAIDGSSVQANSSRRRQSRCSCRR